MPVIKTAKRKQLLGIFHSKKKSSSAYFIFLPDVVLWLVGRGGGLFLLGCHLQCSKQIFPLGTLRSAGPPAGPAPPPGVLYVYVFLLAALGLVATWRRSLCLMTSYLLGLVVATTAKVIISVVLTLVIKGTTQVFCLRVCIPPEGTDRKSAMEENSTGLPQPFFFVECGFYQRKTFIPLINFVGKNWRGGFSYDSNNGPLRNFVGKKMAGVATVTNSNNRPLRGPKQRHGSVLITLADHGCLSLPGRVVVSQWSAANCHQYFNEAMAAAWVWVFPVIVCLVYVLCAAWARSPPPALSAWGEVYGAWTGFCLRISNRLKGGVSGGRVEDVEPYTFPFLLNKTGAGTGRPRAAFQERSATTSTTCHMHTCALLEVKPEMCLAQPFTQCQNPPLPWPDRHPCSSVAFKRAS